MGVLLAILGVAGVVSAISGYMGAEAQSEAYKALAEATDNEKKMLQAEYDKAYGEGSFNQKMQDIGINAAKDIQGLLGDESAWDKYIGGDNAWQEYPEFSFTAEDLYSDPSYQTRIDEGRKALEQSLVSQGYGGTGYAAKELEKYAQEQAAKEYQAAYNRKYGEYTNDRSFDYNAWKNEANQYYQNLQTQLSGLQGLSNQGQQAQTNQTNALMTLAGQKANAGIQSAQANAAAGQADTEKWTSVLDALSKMGMQGAGVYAAYNGAGATPTNTTPTSTTNQSTNEYMQRLLGGLSDNLGYGSLSQPSTSNLTLGA